MTRHQIPGLAAKTVARLRNVHERPLADGPVIIGLPFPPTVNSMFRNVAGAGRVRAREYVTWSREAGILLNTQRPCRIDGPVSIRIDLCPHDQRRFDIDNRVKPVLDLLVEHRVIPDDTDNIVRRITVERVYDAADCVVTISGYDIEVMK